MSLSPKGEWLFIPCGNHLSFPDEKPHANEDHSSSLESHPSGRFVTVPSFGSPGRVHRIVGRRLSRPFFRLSPEARASGWNRSRCAGRGMDEESTFHTISTSCWRISLEIGCKNRSFLHEKRTIQPSDLLRNGWNVGKRWTPLLLGRGSEKMCSVSQNLYKIKKVLKKQRIIRGEKMNSSTAGG